MPLSIGARLGPYEIIGPLGAGGMGEVYKARDPRLSRLIAIKLLPAAAAADPERRDRFEREAKAIAALNHPNIVTIYSVEQADGLFFLTMEFVEGRSLAEALPRGGLSIDPLLKIAIPVADAMAAAHQKGITHRDLKPGNIMLGEGEHAGRVKVLDFGLAKLQGDRSPYAKSGDLSPTAGATNLPTGPVTGEGTILGTVAYMSPEQAEGKPVDARSDLFSLGVMLYEMATGQRPFTGDTSVSIITSILRDTPKSLTELNPVLPSDLGRIVRRALVKDPERRYQTAKDLRNDLEEVKASLDSGELVAQATDLGAVPRSRGARGWRLAAAALTVALALAGGIYALVQRRAQPFSPENLQVTQLTSTGNASRPAISPDGNYVVYVQQDGEDYSLWVRQTATASNVQIVPPEKGVPLYGATVTPDGAFVDFIRWRQPQPPELWRVPFLGGTPKRVMADVWTPIAWAPDGEHMVFVRRGSGLSSLMIAAADGRHERPIVERWQGEKNRPGRPAGGLAHLAVLARPSIAPAWSPNGRVVAAVGSRSSARDETLRELVVYCAEMSNGSERVIRIPLPALGVTGNPPEGLTWLDDAALMLIAPADAGAPSQLWRLSYPEGRLSRLTNDVIIYRGLSLTAARDALVTTRTDSRASVWVGDGGAQTGTDIVPPVSFFGGAPGFASVTWAGDRLLYAAASGRLAVASILPGRGAPQEIVANARIPVATSDGRTVVFESTRTGAQGGIWKIDAEGLDPRQLVTGPLAFAPLGVVNDRHVLFLSSRSGLQAPWTVPIEGGTPTQVVNALRGTPYSRRITGRTVDRVSVTR